MDSIISFLHLPDSFFTLLGGFGILFFLLGFFTNLGDKKTILSIGKLTLPFIATYVAYKLLVVYAMLYNWHACWIALLVFCLGIYFLAETGENVDSDINWYETIEDTSHKVKKNKKKSILESKSIASIKEREVYVNKLANHSYLQYQAKETFQFIKDYIKRTQKNKFFSFYLNWVDKEDASYNHLLEMKINEAGNFQFFEDGKEIEKDAYDMMGFFGIINFLKRTFSIYEDIWFPETMDELLQDLENKTYIKAFEERYPNILVEFANDVKVKITEWHMYYVK